MENQNNQINTNNSNVDLTPNLATNDINKMLVELFDIQNTNEVEFDLMNLMYEVLSIDEKQCSMDRNAISSSLFTIQKICEFLRKAELIIQAQKIIDNKQPEQRNFESSATLKDLINAIM